MGSSLRVLSSFGSSRPRNLSLLRSLKFFLGLGNLLSLLSEDSVLLVVLGVESSGVAVEVEVGGVILAGFGAGAVRYPSREMAFPPIVRAFGSVFVFLLLEGRVAVGSDAILLVIGVFLDYTCCLSLSREIFSCTW